MVESFFERPILNSPYDYPGRYWELDADGQPTNRILDRRRRSELVTPVPKPQKRRRAAGQGELGLGSGDGLSTAEQEYNPTPIINEIRAYVAAWRNLPNPNQWQVTPRRRGCSSIGGIINSTICAHSSARSKQSRRRSGSPRWPPIAQRRAQGSGPISAAPTRRRTRSYYASR